MKNKVISVVLALFAAVSLSSCATAPQQEQQQGYGAMPPESLNAYAEGGHGGPPPRPNFGPGDGNGGPPGAYEQTGDRQQFAEQGHGGPPGMSQGGRPELIDNGGQFAKSKWQNGVNRHTYKVRALVSTFNKALTPSEKLDLGLKIEQWAIASVKEDKQPPTDAEATTEAQRIVGHQKVRIKIESNFSEEFISQERKLISRENVDEASVPEDAKNRLRQSAQESFYQNQKNELVKDDKFYPN